MVNVIFYGNLAEEFGAERKLNISSFKEIGKCLEVNTGRFRKFIIDQTRKGVFYRIIVNGQAICSLLEIENYQFPKKNSEMEVVIIPVPMGRIGGLGSKGTSYLSIGVGALFVAVGAVLLATGVGSALAVPFIFAGISLIAAGVIGLLSPQPKFQPDIPNGQSFLFDGILATSREGSPVPLVYGRLLVQGITVNSVINTIDTDGTGTGYDACSIGTAATLAYITFTISTTDFTIIIDGGNEFKPTILVPYNIAKNLTIRLKSTIGLTLSGNGIAGILTTLYPQAGSRDSFVYWQKTSTCTINISDSSPDDTSPYFHVIDGIFVPPLSAGANTQLNLPATSQGAILPIGDPMDVLVNNGVPISNGGIDISFLGTAPVKPINLDFEYSLDLIVAKSQTTIA